MTPVLEQYKKIKAKYTDALLFFRMGDFYEMFYDDAITASRELDIALTARSKGKEYEAPMCGVPVKAVDGYVAKLIKKGFRVAICEQLGDPALSKGPVERDVVRVVTPGTVVEQDILEEKENNYICAVVKASDLYGTAFIDISTGEFITSECLNAEEVLDQIYQFAPKELVVPEEQEQHGYITASVDKMLISPRPEWDFQFNRAEEKLCAYFEVKTTEGFGLKGHQVAVRACGGLLAYLEETQKTSLAHLNNPKIFRTSEHLIMDPSTQRNLELFHPLVPDRTEGTLFDLMDKSLTGMGGRLLRSWMLRPLIVKKEILSRLESVEEFSIKSMDRDNIREKLKKIYDIERILSRISLGTVKPRDLVCLKVSLAVLPEIRKTLCLFDSTLLSVLVESFDELADIYELLERAIFDEPALTVREGGIIKDGYDNEVDELREISRGGKSYIARIEKKEKERTGIEKLKIRYNKVFGYFIEVSRSKADSVPDDYIRKQTLVNCERYITEELKEYESKVLSADDKLNLLEYELFCKIRDTIGAEFARIQKTAGVLAHIDVLSSFSVLAGLNNYCRPEMVEDGSIVIKEGRHPVVEKLNSQSFVPNNTLLDCEQNRILIITGPNMGGKSTYLRQVALITLMAQMGSYVPASEASISIVDRIFTRVGASDNLVMGQSTFMVEMTETANILNNATANSLVILDEVGRGTSTFDGVSLAWSVVEYLHENKNVAAKTLFATHYHELTDLAGILSDVQNFTIAVREWNDEIVFLHRIEPGSADKSYGIHVAKLAGVPKAVIKRAKEILSNLEKNEFTKEGLPRIGQGPGSPAELPQPTLFDTIDPIVEEMKTLDLNSMTPMEAMNKLNELLEKIRNR